MLGRHAERRSVQLLCRDRPCKSLPLRRVGLGTRVQVRQGADRRPAVCAMLLRATVGGTAPSGGTLYGSAPFVAIVSSRAAAQSCTAPKRPAAPPEGCRSAVRGDGALRRRAPCRCSRTAATLTSPAAGAWGSRVLRRSTLDRRSQTVFGQSVIPAFQHTSAAAADAAAPTFHWFRFVVEKIQRSSGLPEYSPFTSFGPSFGSVDTAVGLGAAVAQVRILPQIRFMGAADRVADVLELRQN